MFNITDSLTSSMKNTVDFFNYSLPITSRTMLTFCFLIFRLQTNYNILQTYVFKIYFSLSYSKECLLRQKERITDEIQTRVAFRFTTSYFLHNLQLSLVPCSRSKYY